MIQFAHLSSGVLTASANQATDALPLYTPRNRARIAARLRTAVESGHLKSSDVTLALAQPLEADHAVAALGARLQKRFRAMSRGRPSLPVDLIPPFDPVYESDEMRRVLKVWGNALLDMGAIKADTIRSAVHAGGRALAEAITSSCSTYAKRSLADLYTACGVTQSTNDRPIWIAIPAWLELIEPAAAIEAVLSLPNDYSFTATMTTLTEKDAGAMLLFGALSTLRLRTLTLVTPEELGSEGLVGSTFFADIESYVGDCVQPDGTVVLTDDFLEHMNQEYGIERSDEVGLARLKKMLSFIARKDEVIPSFKSAQAAIKSLRQYASTLDNAAASAALLGVASLISLNEKAAQHSLKDAVSVETMDEEAYVSGMHILTADLTGYEESTLDDLHEMNMQVGSQGGVFVQSTSAAASLSLAVREASVITVLSTLISAYAEAMK